jgi:hypothetical protein
MAVLDVWNKEHGMGVGGEERTYVLYCIIV